MVKDVQYRTNVRGGAQRIKELHARCALFVSWLSSYRFVWRWPCGIRRGTPAPPLPGLHLAVCCPTPRLMRRENPREIGFDRIRMLELGEGSVVFTVVFW